MLPMLASAFEPGQSRVCEPSADGLRFECRDKSGAAADPQPAAAQAAPRAPASPPVATPANAPPPVPVVADAPSTRPTASLPDYLRAAPGRDAADDVPAAKQGAGRVDDRGRPGPAPTNRL